MKKLGLYHDIFQPVAQNREEPEETNEATDEVAGIIGGLIAQSALHDVLCMGNVALAQGDLGKAEQMFREAARLDPNALQPKKLLEEATAKQRFRNK